MADKTENKAYDKILRENIGQFFLSLSEKYLDIPIAKSEELKDQLYTTLEKEADFLRIIHSPSGEKFILHLEFQTKDERDMIYRMQEYFGILRKKYGLPVRQLVIYLGASPSKMQTQLREEEVFRGFALKSLHELDYQVILESEIPEEIMLAILCNFKKEEAQEVLSKIIQRLQELSKDAMTLQKYIRQLLVLSRLRNLTAFTTKQLQDMALVYDIEKDALYQKGEQIGIQKGEQIGELKTKIQGIQKALTQGKLTSEEIADLFEVSLDFIIKVKAGEIS
ncbi:MAG: hypothetical protein HC913_01445 [Microscillaceae bacterium]|nr:hypothetical protein [Microscillaceae bacterium]